MTCIDPRRPARIAGLLFAAGTLVAVAALPLAARASPADDYIAARETAVATLAAAEKAGLKLEELGARDEAARKVLETRMAALLGPLRFTGLDQPPVFSPGTLLDGDMESGAPDGLLFADKDFTTRLLVSPEPVFTHWLATRARDANADPALGQGIKAAAASDLFYTLVISADAAFSGYMALPVTAAEGETAYAALGLFSQDIAGNSPPDTIVITRVADGRVTVGASDVKLAIKPLPACDKLWKATTAKAATLRKAAQKSKKDDDPRFDQAAQAEDEGAAAYRACFAKEAQGQPFFTAALKRAEALLATARGK
ncbi:hypothetical protein EZH22_08070 [Xanthobacter dioxanivorans]|uniref:Uncharacterized protein n=1 Tax=Xanthobacter dioxanivorans TaxID=2528964 RepID=A0A974PS27_9HYPH|nr:hypothetical protein [Xanthobacter dioxanivorans]QRG08253.1 hypothetical protein EZH22_08070 [Xanthobacter dioxanivorans]